MGSRTLTIRLLRKDRDLDSAFTESFRPNNKRALERRDLAEIEGGHLFIGQIYNNPPGWVDFLTSIEPGLPDGMRCVSRQLPPSLCGGPRYVRAALGRFDH